jgi:hypothetical protein
MKEDQNYSPWLLFHAQNVLEFFSDNLEIEHWKFNTSLKYSYIHSLYYSAIMDVLNQKQLLESTNCVVIFFSIFFEIKKKKSHTKLYLSGPPPFPALYSPEITL